MNGCCVANYDLCINQGATYQPNFIWTAGGCGVGTVGASPQPVDLTGYTAAMQFRNYYGGTLLYDASADIVLGGTAGTIALTIPASVTETFTWYSGVYDLLLTSAQGVATRLLAGNVNVSQGVTT
jgi:hypothetical protein